MKPQRHEGKLRPSLHQRLRLLAGGPRRYAKGDQEIPGLMRMGLVEPSGATSADGSREWAITDAGRLALQDHAGGEALMPARPSVRFRERKVTPQ